MNESMNKLYFTRALEKTRGLFTSSTRPRGKLLLTKDTVSDSVLSTCTKLLLTKDTVSYSMLSTCTKLLLTKDTVSYSMLSTCTFIQFMLK